MDKPKKGNTIKIKLNGEEQHHQEDSPKKETVANIYPIPRVIKVNSDLSESDGFIETAAAQEPVDESFDWIIPESAENDIEEFHIPSSNKTPKKSGTKKLTSFSPNFKKKTGQPFGSILISATFAILIGLTIGFVMLKLVITETDGKVDTEPTAVEVNGSKENKPATGKAGTAVIGQVTAYLVQGGVYSSKDGAKETAAQLTSHGIPSQLIEKDGQQFIFLGVADSMETAKSLSGQYNENGAEGAFPKSLLLKEKKFSDISAKEINFLEAVPTIYETLSMATSSAMLTQEIPEESSKALVTIEDQLKVTSIKNAKVKKLQAELTSADEKVKTYQKSKDTKDLTEAQQHLLNFLSSYYSM
ncbi:hypothetical protein [Neobacillus soli]|uniref:hypothetical protein n=1 Tax=Neobacillus soli TaxID=220688 RepID=UPI000824062B|nr:hypothetical protein [Neobacillus soli]